MKLVSQIGKKTNDICPCCNVKSAFRDDKLKKQIEDMGKQFMTAEELQNLSSQLENMTNEELKEKLLQVQAEGLARELYPDDDQIFTIDRIKVRWDVNKKKFQGKNINYDELLGQLQYAKGKQGDQGCNGCNVCSIF